METDEKKDAAKAAAAADGASQAAGDAELEDIKKEVFDELESTLSMQCKIGKYNQLMKERVDWTLYVRYCIYQCDVYVDVFSIVVCTQHIYGEQISEREIMDCIEKNIEKHHILTY